MKILLLCACLLAGHGGDREKGLQCYREGRYAEAAAAFRAAIESEGDSADLQFNLALASWRAGDLATAETAVEKYAAMAADARTDLHAGLLGALRHEEAKLHEAKADALMAGSGQPAVAPDAAAPEDPLPLLEQGLQKAVQSQDYFLRGVKAKPTPELLRNVERSLRTIEEIEKKIEDLKKQREQKKDDEKKDGEKKPDEKNEQKDDKKGDKNKESDDKSEPDNDQKKPDEKQEPKPEGKGDEKPEPKPGQQEQKGDESKPQPDKPGEPKSGDKPPEPQPQPQPEPKPGEKPRTDAPGEVAEGKELSPEQTQRLMEQLENLDGKLKSFRARAKTGRRPVERDW